VTATLAAGSLGQRLAIAASVVVLATIVASVWVNGTPSEQREIKLDARRVEDLRNLDSEIKVHALQKGALPTSLASLAEKPGISLTIVDPVTSQPYEFEPIRARTYRLCATFTTDTAKTRAAADYRAGAEHWAHGAGRRCFERDAGAKGD